MINGKKNIDTLQQLLQHDAAQFIMAELQLAEQMPEWIGKVQSLQLKSILRRYLDYTRQHVSKTGALKDFHVPLAGSNRIMAAFIASINEKLCRCNDADVKDACLLAGIQAINHYKLCAYGTAGAYAVILGMEQEAMALHEAAMSEKQIDDRLSQLAEFETNVGARAPVIFLPGY